MLNEIRDENNVKIKVDIEEFDELFKCVKIYR